MSNSMSDCLVRSEASPGDFVEISRYPQASGGKLLPALVGVIEADQAGDRRSRDGFARQIAALHEHDFNQMHWYRSLDAQMTTKKRFARSGQLPPHPPAPRAVTDHASFTTAFGAHAIATQLRAGQIGEPVVVDTALQEHLAELERQASASVLPRPGLLLDLAALHRLGDDTQASDQVLHQLLDQGNGDANDQAIALVLLGLHTQLLAIVDDPDQDNIHNGVVAYASIAHGQAQPALDDLIRWASKQSPSETGVDVWFHEVIDLAVTRFKL